MKAISCWTICATTFSRGTGRTMFSSNARIRQALRAGCLCGRSNGHASSLAHRVSSEFRADIVYSTLDRGAARRGLIQKIGRIALDRRADLTQSDAEQAIGGPRRFARKKHAPNAK